MHRKLKRSIPKWIRHWWTTENINIATKAENANIFGSNRSDRNSNSIIWDWLFPIPGAVIRRDRRKCRATVTTIDNRKWQYSCVALILPFPVVGCWPRKTLFVFVVVENTIFAVEISTIMILSIMRSVRSPIWIIEWQYYYFGTSSKSLTFGQR